MGKLMLRERDSAILRATFGQFPEIKEVRLFGSRANGTARRASDIDLAIYAPAVTPRRWADLCDALERTPIIYDLDLVRPELSGNEQLKAKIANDGVAIFPTY